MNMITLKGSTMRNFYKKSGNFFSRPRKKTRRSSFERKVFVGLDASGDVVFTSGQHLSTSAIALGDSSGGDADWWGVGRIPAVANVKGAVAARLPDDNIYDKKTGVSRPNKSKFSYCDGHGNMIRMKFDEDSTLWKMVKYETDGCGDTDA